MKTPLLILYTSILFPLISRAGNDEIALQRTERVLEIFQQLIYPKSEGSSTALYMLDIGIGAKFGDSEIEIEDITKKLANQSLFIHGIKADGQENTRPRAEVLSLTPFPLYYNTFIQNHKTPKPTAEQQEKLKGYLTTKQKNARARIAAMMERDEMLGNAWAKKSQGKINSTQMNDMVGAANDLYDSNEAVVAVNEANQAIETLNAELGGAIWKARQASATAANSAKWPVVTIPSIQQLSKEGDTDKNGWVSHTFTTKSLKTSSQHSETTASVGYSGWFFNASGAYKRVSSDDDTLIDDMTVSFKVKRVSCYREWLDLGSFGDSSYDPIHPKKEMPILSSGKLEANGYYGGDGTPQMGVCPFVVLDLIFVKDVVLEAPWKDEHNAFVSEAISGSAGYGFGPFRIGGGGSRNWDKTDAKCDKANHKITIETPQLIGYIAYKLPACPLK
jgi:hypothetical protein